MTPWTRRRRRACAARLDAMFPNLAPGSIAHIAKLAGFDVTADDVYWVRAPDAAARRQVTRLAH